MTNMGDYYQAYGLLKFPEGYSINTIIFFPLKTARGIVYVNPSPNGYYCYQSHVFDRYLQRSNQPANRENAIRYFSKMLLGKGFKADPSLLPQGKVRLFLYGGILLGNWQNNVILYRTFISEDLFRPNQITALQKSLLEIESNPEKADSMAIILHQEFLKRKTSAL